MPKPEEPPSPSSLTPLKTIVERQLLETQARFPSFSRVVFSKDAGFTALSERAQEALSVVAALDEEKFKVFAERLTQLRELAKSHGDG